MIRRKTANHRQKRSNRLGYDLDISRITWRDRVWEGYWD